MYNFTDNKYKKWYFNIIKNAQTRRKVEGYVENHHIVPKSLGGSNSKTNLVKLTAREHFIVHLLLIRIVEKKDVYRMVHAVIRFTTKVDNSRQYELLRKYVSRFSMGEYNASYGKMWVYLKNTNEIKYIKVEEFNSNIHIKGLPYQRGGTEGHYWVNNGIEESLINNNDDMPSGWYKGRIFKPSTQQIKKINAARHTPEKDQQHSEVMSGRIQIFNESLQQSKRINPKSLNEYTKLGWKRKSVPTKLSRSFNITGIKYFTIKDAMDDLNLSRGTIEGRLKSSNTKFKEWQYD